MKIKHMTRQKKYLVVVQYKKLIHIAIFFSSEDILDFPKN